MGGSYKQCGECGKRALSIATRCPGCGREFPIPAAPETSPTPALGRFLTPRVVVGVLAVAGALTAANLGRTSLPPEVHSLLVAEEQSSFVSADTSMAAAEVAYASAVRPVESAGELLVARDWSSVRKGRSRRTDLEAVLMPGDTVVADSLERGWYRVALDGEVLGYVHRSMLREPPRARSN